MVTNKNIISQSKLLQIYETVTDLENNCSCAVECWKNIKNLKGRLGKTQVPYRPFVGSDYKGILFAGINLNNATGSENEIEILKDKAVEDYLKKKKYKIFKSKKYGGSPFYYYVPLLAYLYHIYINGHNLIETEQEISFEQIAEGFEYCGLTNLIKCCVPSQNRRSTPSLEMYKNCIGKFCQELDLIEYNVLVVFTYFKCRFLSGLLDRYTLMHDGNRYRIHTNGKSRLVELEHPLSTNITRPAKFISYSRAIYNVVNLPSVVKLQ